MRRLQVARCIRQASARHVGICSNGRRARMHSAPLPPFVFQVAFQTATNPKGCRKRKHISASPVRRYNPPAGGRNAANA
nr:MAG TPA: hypothetical protein [Caudoviricetes sp.]